MYAVLGATGNTGAGVARELLSAGMPVRAIARDPDRAAALRERGAEIAVADLRDRGQLATALRGVQGAYVMLPPCHEAEDMLAEACRIADTIGAAVAEAKVPYVVLLSSMGAQHARGTGPIAGNHHAEQALRGAAPALCILRAAYFMENWVDALGTVDQGELVTMLTPERAIPMIAVADIGRMAAEKLRAGAHGEQVIGIEGPRPYSPRDVADALTALVGRPVTPAFVPNDAVVATLMQLGLGARNAELFREMNEAIDQGRVVDAGEGAPVERGRVPLEEVLRRALKREGGAEA